MLRIINVADTFYPGFAAPTALPKSPPKRRAARGKKRATTVEQVSDVAAASDHVPNNPRSRRSQHQMGPPSHAAEAGPLPSAIDGAPINPAPQQRVTNHTNRTTVTIEEEPDIDAPRSPQAGTSNIHQPTPGAPVPDVNSNPFLDPPAAPRTPPNEPGPSPSTSRRFYSVAPSTASPRPRGAPRAGRHSLPRRFSVTGPVGNKHRHSAKDVWTFFEEMEDKKGTPKHGCLFCK